jgi:hypothetical protein
MYSELDQFEDWQTYLGDGLHLSIKGNRLFFDKLMQLIKEKIPECNPDTMTMPLPDHKVVDINNLENSLKIQM